MKIKTVNYTIKDSKIPEGLSGYRIALFSDTHNMLFGKDCEDIIKPLSEAHPDIVVFAGDAVKKSRNNKNLISGYENAAGLFKAVSSLFPVFFVTGNHDKRFEKISKRTRYYRDFIRELKDAGIRLLFNKKAEVANGLITLYGIDLPLKSYRHSCAGLSEGDIKRLIGSPDPDTFNLLLVHTPRFFKSYASWGADLSLCGHIHGGMIRLGKHGLLSPHKQLFPEYCYGLYEDGGKKMIVSSGAGDHNIRFTLCNPFEICIITLETGDKENGT